MKNSEPRLNLLILESSKIVAARLVDLVMNLEGINEILYGPTFDKPISLLLSNRVDIILCGIDLTDENVARLNELRSICRPFYFIALSNCMQEEYSKKYPYLPFDSLINERDVPNKMRELIIEATQMLTRRSRSFQS